MRQERKEQRERDWLGRILTNSKLERNSESPYLLEGPLNELMEREKVFLEQHPQEKANGFYRRLSISLAVGVQRASVRPRDRRLSQLLALGPF